MKFITKKSKIGSATKVSSGQNTNGRQKIIFLGMQNKKIF